MQRYGCNNCGNSQHAASNGSNVLEKATHWLCAVCKDEVSVRRNQCLICSCWRPKHGPLVNLGRDAEELLVHLGRLPRKWSSTGGRWSIAAQAVANAAYIPALCQWQRRTPLSTKRVWEGLVLVSPMSPRPNQKWTRRCHRLLQWHLRIRELLP